MLMQKLEEMAQAITSYKGHKVAKASRHEEALRSKKVVVAQEPALQTLLETKYLKAETVQVEEVTTPRQHSMTATFKQPLGCRNSIEKADTNHNSIV